MKKMLLYIALILVLATGTNLAQVAGDFGSLGTGNWGTTGANWVVFVSAVDWSDATPAGAAPGNSNNVWIRNGHIVTMEASSKKAQNLTIETGGTLLFVNSSNTLTINGNLTINGICGDLTNAPLLQFMISGTISGSGTFYFGRIRPTTNTGVKVTVDMNGTGVLAGSSVINCNNLNNFTLEVSATRTLTTASTGYISVGSNSSTADPSTAANLTLNIYGTINVPCGTGGGIGLANKPGFTSTLNVYNGGIVNAGRINAIAGGTADANAINVNIYSGGTINLTTGSPSPLSNDMTKANMNIQGTFNPGITGTMSSVTLGKVILNNGTSVTFSDPTTIAGLLTLTSGKVILGTNLVLTTLSGGSASNYFVFDNAGTGSVALNVSGTSPWLLPVGTSSYYTPLTLTYSVAPTVAGKITLSKVTPDMIGSDLSPSLSDGGYTLLRRSNQYWSYSNTCTGGTYDLSLDGSSSQMGIDNSPNLRIVHSADGITFDLVGTHASGSGSVANRTGIPDGTSGRFYLGGQVLGENPLPVELSSFTASNQGRNIQLNWETKTEKNSDRFEIQRSSVGNLNWAVVGSVKAAVLSNSTKNYSFSDTKLQSGKYEYRLKMIDNNGSFSYSSVETAEVAVPKDFAVSQNYPNPFNPSTKIDYQVPIDAKVVMEVYNIAGQKVVELVNQEQSAGYYTVDFGASKLSSGIYIYRLSASDKITGNNFSSIKKMMLLK
jgi:hypothetical protein